MEKTLENFFCREFIGLKAKVVESTDPERKGFSGKIVDETMNTFVFESKGREKIVPKKEVLLKFFLPGRKTVLVLGKKILARPEDRVKSFLGKKIE